MLTLTRPLCPHNITTFLLVAHYSHRHTVTYVTLAHIPFLIILFQTVSGTSSLSVDRTGWKSFTFYVLNCNSSGSTQNISTHTHTHTHWETQCVCTAVENLHYHGGRLPSSTVTSNRVSLSQLCVRARATESLQVYGCVSDSICVCVCYRVPTWFTVRGETPVNSLFGAFVQACRRACMFRGAPDHGRTGSGGLVWKDSLVI